MSWTTTKALVALFGCLLLTAGVRGANVADLPRAKPEAVGMSSVRLARVTDTMQRYIDADQLAGAVTLIARHGKVVHLEGQGWRD